MVFKGVIADDLEITNGDNLSHDCLISLINSLKNLNKKIYKTYSNIRLSTSYFTDFTNYTIKATNCYLDDGMLVCEGTCSDLSETELVTIYTSEIDITEEEVKSITSFSMGYPTYTDDGYVIRDLYLTLSVIYETKTLTIGTVNLEKLTEDEKEIATNRGWILK